MNPSSSLKEPGFVLEVRKDGERLALIASGAADIEQERQVTAKTVFHIASLSKQITAAALAQAILDGKVSLEDPVAKWIPETAKYGDELTVAHLVYMTSGLTEYYDVPRKSGEPWSTFHYFTVEEAIAASLSVDALAFEPGTQWRYSNINYMLLTEIIANAYGEPFSDVVKEKIFTPLSMNASLINDDGTTIIPNRANAYAPRSVEIVQELRSIALDLRDGDGYILIRRNAPHYGGSGVMTSMDDWSHWQDEILSHETFGDDFWALMLSTRIFAHDKSNDAFGLVHGEHDGRKTLWYEGGDIDASSYAVTIPESGLSVSCFSNNPTSSCGDRVRGVLDVLAAEGSL